MPLILHPADERIRIKTDYMEMIQTFNPESVMPELSYFGILTSLTEVTMFAGSSKKEMERLKNTETVTVVLEGKTEFFDSSGNTGIFGSDEVQAVSSGSGIYFGRHNYSESDLLRFLEFQILPNQINLSPSVNKKAFNISERNNQFQLIAAPSGTPEAVQINQNAFVFAGKFNKAIPVQYASQDSENGIYIFMISGEAIIGGITIRQGDGLGISEYDKIEILPQTEIEILVIEVPMI